MPSWIFAGLAWVVVFFGCYWIAALIDEDVNHWEWDGPGPSWGTTARQVVIAGLIATTAVAAGAFVLRQLPW